MKAKGRRISEMGGESALREHQARLRGIDFGFKNVLLSANKACVFNIYT